MKAVVVYELHWGNTAEVARAIAEGLGPGAIACSTADASPDLIRDAKLLVVGAPVMGFRLPTDAMRAQIAADPDKAPSPPDLSHPSMRDWLAVLPEGSAPAAAFETRIWWSLGGAVGAIGKALRAHGHELIRKPERFVVTGTYGPLRAGEVERARAWGAALAQQLGQPTGLPA